MQVRNIMLAGVGLLVVVMFVKLVLDAQGDASPQVKDAELHDALSTYKRGESKSARTSATPEYVAPTKRRTTVGVSPQPETESVPETYSAPMPEEEEQVFDDQMALKNQMNDANRFYDKADYESARDAALEVLGKSPNNVRMLRIVVSSSCIMAEEEMATRYYESLPDRDKRQMARRCTRYGIEFQEPQ